MSSPQEEPQLERLPTFIRFDDAPSPRASPPRRPKLASPNREASTHSSVPKPSQRRAKRDKEQEEVASPPPSSPPPMVLSELDWNYQFVLQSIQQDDFEAALDCLRSYPSLLNDHPRAVDTLMALCRVNLPPHRSPSSSPPSWLVYYELVQTVLALQPKLVRHVSSNATTPLHAAVANPTLSPLVLEWLVLVDQEWFTDIPHPVDADGLTLLDHVLYRLALEDDATATMELLNTLLRCLTRTTAQMQQRSPLLHVLTIFPSTQPSQMKLLLSCCRVLLEWNADLLHQISTTTGCTPLHVGLRNHGHCRELLDVLECQQSWQTRNRYGDLPLHVACSAGVPYDILQWSLQCTYSACTKSHPHPLIWSVNNAGYTPADLEWMRHIEAGHGFLSSRSFLVLDARGVRPLVGRYHDLYSKLLRQSVDAVMHAPVRKPPYPSRGTVGLLLHRIVLLVQACFGDCWKEISTFPRNDTLLHHATALVGTRADGPSLPLPIVEMILWQHPEQLSQPDSSGKVPLHYAVQAKSFRNGQGASAKPLQDWLTLVDLLVRRCHEACRVVDRSGRLALHYALQYHDLTQVDDAREAAIASGNTTSTVSRIVQLLLESYPHSTEVLDPVSGLYPFHLAAMHPLLNLEARFQLLRRNPRIIAGGKKPVF